MAVRHDSGHLRLFCRLCQLRRNLEDPLPLSSKSAQSHIRCFILRRIVIVISFFRAFCLSHSPHIWYCPPIKRGPLFFILFTFIAPGPLPSAQCVKGDPSGRGLHFVEINYGVSTTRVVGHGMNLKYTGETLIFVYDSPQNVYAEPSTRCQQKVVADLIGNPVKCLVNFMFLLLPYKA